VKVEVESQEDLVRLARMYCAGTVTAEEYYAAADRYASRCVAAEVRDYRLTREEKRSALDRAKTLREELESKRR
jgi:hypothetical protein